MRLLHERTQRARARVAVLALEPNHLHRESAVVALLLLLFLLEDRHDLVHVAEPAAREEALDGVLGLRAFGFPNHFVAVLVSAALRELGVALHFGRRLARAHARRELRGRQKSYQAVHAHDARGAHRRVQRDAVHEVDNVGVRDHRPVAVVRRRQRDERFEFLAQVIADLLAQLARRVVRAIG